MNVSLAPLGDDEVSCRRAPRPLVGNHFKGDLLAVLQTLETRTLYGGDVDEDVLAAVVWLNEAKAFLGVEPFHCAGGH